jgi:hypothetical protein
MPELSSAYLHHASTRLNIDDRGERSTVDQEVAAAQAWAIIVLAEQVAELRKAVEKLAGGR